MRPTASAFGLILAALAVPAGAQPAGAQFRVDAFTTSEGLPQNTVSALAQTADGHLWIGTYDGLARYDGIRFTVFDRGNAPALRSTQFLTLFADSRGTLWGGTVDGGVVRYRDGRFASLTHREGLEHDYVGRIQEAPAGPLFFYGEDSVAGVWHEPGGPAKASPADLAEYRGRSGTRWVHTADGVTAIRGAARVPHPAAIPLDEFARFRWEEDAGTLWVGTHRDGVYRLRRGEVRRFGAADGIPAGQRVRVAGRDHEGRVWLFGDSVLLRQAGERFEPVAVGRAGRQIRAALVDREGTVWVGTNAGGLLRVAPEVVAAYAWSPGGEPLAAAGVIAEPDGSVRVGTARGAPRLRSGAFVAPGAGIAARSFFRDRNGSLWVGAGGRLTEESPTGVVDHSALVGEATVNAILRDRAGVLWVGTNRGLLRVANGRGRLYTVADGLPGRIVATLLEDRAGRLWVGTNGGLMRVEPGRFIVYHGGEGPISGKVRALYQDASGALWVGTFDRGLGRIAGGRVTAFSTRTGLPSNGVFALVEDRRGNFWISSNRGIYRVARRQLEEAAAGIRATVAAVAYGIADGMRTVECNGGFQPAATRTPDGRIWFPTQEGVVAVDPERADRGAPAPVPLIERVAVEGRVLEPGGGVRLAPGERNLEIGYTAPSFHKPEYVQFRYRLAGLGDAWMDAGTRRSVHYSSLPPGSYTFALQAAGSDGAWGEATSQLSVVVEPHLWQTRWFAAAVLIAVAGIGAGASLARVRRLQATERRLALLVGERTTELAVANARLEELASRDPLTGLANRRHFDAFFEMELRRAARTGTPVALLMLDVDFFKRFNDFYGHPEGDECLRRVASVVGGAVGRATDLAARYGGEEFAVVLGGSDLNGAIAVAESIRAAVAEMGLLHKASSVAPHVTVSVGVAALLPTVAADPMELIAAADVALYHAKERGRNRVEVGEARLVRV